MKTISLTLFFVVSFVALDVQGAPNGTVHVDHGLVSPKIVRVNPEKMVTAVLYNRTVLVCEAEGNPQPSYQWLQKTSTADETVYVRGVESMLVIHNVTYEYQGKYYCKASNVISGTERTIQSEPIDLRVVGAPQVLRNVVESEVTVEKGSDATLSVVFCSNPRPLNVIWEWGSLKLEAGYDLGRFTAEKIDNVSRNDCYEAKLRVAKADSADSRHYYLNVENNEGSDKYSVVLHVRGEAEHKMNPLDSDISSRMDTIDNRMTKFNYDLNSKMDTTDNKLTKLNSDFNSKMEAIDNKMTTLQVDIIKILDILSNMTKISSTNNHAHHN